MAPALHEGDKVLFLGRAHYGCVATVIPPPVAGRGRKVMPPAPNLRNSASAICCLLADQLCETASGSAKLGKFNPLCIMDRPLSTAVTESA